MPDSSRARRIWSDGHWLTFTPGDEGSLIADPSKVPPRDLIPASLNQAQIVPDVNMDAARQMMMAAPAGPVAMTPFPNTRYLSAVQRKRAQTAIVGAPRG